jgi:hypothetical protein
MFNLCRETEGRHYSFIQIVKAEYKRLTIYLVTELVSIAFDFQWKQVRNWYIKISMGLHYDQLEYLLQNWCAIIDHVMKCRAPRYIFSIADQNCM